MIIEQMNLKKISNLKKNLMYVWGYQIRVGHIADISPASLAACAMEKHFTVSREDKDPDSEFSIDPTELKKLVNDTKTPGYHCRAKLLFVNKQNQIIKYLGGQFIL